MPKFASYALARDYLIAHYMRGAISYAALLRILAASRKAYQGGGHVA